MGKGPIFDVEKFRLFVRGLRSAQLTSEGELADR